MRPIATDVARSGACVLSTPVNCAETAEAIEVPFTGLTHVGPSNHVLDGVKIGRVHSPPRGVTRRRCSLLPNYFADICFFFVCCVCETVKLCGQFLRHAAVASY